MGKHSRAVTKANWIRENNTSKNPEVVIKNWTKTKPTKTGKYWFRIDKGSPAYLIFFEVDDIWATNGWWALATPPSFDGDK